MLLVLLQLRLRLVVTALSRKKSALLHAAAVALKWLQHAPGCRMLDRISACLSDNGQAQRVANAEVSIADLQNCELSNASFVVMCKQVLQ